jgi:hypothetical protein
VRGTYASESLTNAAKLPGAGIWPEAVPGKTVAEKREPIELDDSGRAAKVLHALRNCVSAREAIRLPWEVTIGSLQLMEASLAGSPPF